MAGADGVNADHGQHGGKAIPKDALAMASILKEMGVNEYEPRVINQMLEFSYRYITDIIEDARIYSLHASKKQIDLDDVVMAVERRIDHSFTSPPPREFLLEAARAKNCQPLPLIQEKSGLRLPPDRHCLTGSNYRLKTGTINQRKMVQRVSVPGTSQKSSGPVLHGNAALKTAGNVAGAMHLGSIRQDNVLNSQNIARDVVEHRNLTKSNQSGQVDVNEKSTKVMSVKQEASSTVASLPSMEETAASAHNQKFPNLLKRKRDDEETNPVQ